MALTVIPSEPQGRSVQATLKAVLADAKAGAISSIAIAIVHRDGGVAEAWSELPSVPAMIGATARLLHSLNREMDGDEI